MRQPLIVDLDTTSVEIERELRRLKNERQSKRRAIRNAEAEAVRRARLEADGDRDHYE